MTWIEITGTVAQGYGVASGISGDRRFPNGTLALQKPYFLARGLDLDRFYLGTINLQIAPHHYRIKRPRYLFRNVRWSREVPAEDFSFFDCRLFAQSGDEQLALVYYPHPDTKPEHFQEPQVLEILAPYLDGLRYGDRLPVAFDDEQIVIEPAE